MDWSSSWRAGLCWLLLHSQSSANWITVRGTADAESINVSSNGTTFFVDDFGGALFHPNCWQNSLTVQAYDGDDAIILDASLNGVITVSTLNGGAADAVGGASNDAVVIDQFDVIGDEGAGY